MENTWTVNIAIGGNRVAKPQFNTICGKYLYNTIGEIVWQKTCTLYNTICVTHLPVQAEDKEDEEEKTNQPGEVFSPVKILINSI